MPLRGQGPRETPLLWLEVVVWRGGYVGRCDNLARLSCSDTWSNIILDVFVKVFFFLLRRWIFKLVDFEESRLPSLMCVDLIQIVEGLNIIKADLPEQEGILPAYSLCIPSWVFGLPCRFWTYQSSAIAWTHTHTHTHTHTPPVGSVSVDNSD